MTDRRALAGGLCLVIGGLPLFLFYGTQPPGVLGALLVLGGSIITYGAYQLV